MAKNKSVTLSRSTGGSVLIFVFLAIVSVFMMMPLYYSLVQSLKPIDEIFIYPPKLYVKRPTFENFSTLYQLAGNLTVPFSRYLFNSIFVTIVGTGLYLFIATMAGYALAKGKHRGNNLLYVLVVLAMLFRPEVTAIPVYLIVSFFGMLDSYWALILTQLSGTMGVFLIRQYVISAIPDATLEAARIDGASEFKIFTKIALPGIKPAIMTVMIFTFQGIWNSSGTQQYVFSEDLKVLPQVLSTVAAGGIARAGAAAAVSVVMMIPPIAVFLWSQRSVMDTMTHSGLK